jgi:plastocyanin
VAIVTWSRFPLILKPSATVKKRRVINKLCNMKKLLFSLSLSAISMMGFSTTWTIANSGFLFSPASVTIAAGDTVLFTLGSIHNALEVSEATWNANGNTPLSGGFETAFGGGTVLPSSLGVGTHYYVCANHYAMGMKGVIIVQNSSGVGDITLQSNFSIYPNPTKGLLTVKVNSNVMGSPYFITDQTGRQILDGKIINETTLVDISQFAEGVYMFLVTGQRSQSFKVIKN